MAVTAVAKRVHFTTSNSEFRSFVQYTLSGTYVPGTGFVTPFGAVTGNPGSSPLAGTTMIAAQWFSPLGYIYVSTAAARVGNAPPVITTKIYSAPNTELGAVTVPDTSILCAFDITKI